MSGIEKAMAAIVRQTWDNAQEDCRHLADIMTGRVPAGGLYTVKLIDSIHQQIIGANRAQLERLKMEYRGQG